MESTLHQELKARAVKYLWNKSHWVARPEVDCGYYGRYDAWGIKSDLITTGIEVKVSKQDFKNNRYKEAKLNYNLSNTSIFKEHFSAPANFNYILCPKGLLQLEDMDSRFGLLWFNGTRIINKKKAEFIPMTSKTKLQIVMLFLSSKHNKNQLTP